MHGHDHDPWSEYRKRREEWRARRQERREAWREMRAARRATWHAGWGRDWRDAPTEDAGAKTKIAGMQATIDRLLERVAVLEKLATDDDKRLAAEIEKLRGGGQ
jgi:hypothetical protein